MNTEEIMKSFEAFLAYVMNAPVRILEAFRQNPSWIIEIVVIVALIVGLRYYRQWRKKQSQPVLQELIDLFPTVADSETLKNSEKQAFLALKDTYSREVQSKLVSKARLAQLGKIRNDLNFIQKEMNLKRYKDNKALQDIWDLTLNRAATEIADDYELPGFEEKIAVLSKQIEIIGNQSNDKDNN